KAAVGLVFSLGLLTGSARVYTFGFYEVDWTIRESSSDTSAMPVMPQTKSVANATAVSPQPRIDAYGDPLPVGAVARIGSTSLGSDQFTSILGFLRNGKSFVTRNRADGTLCVWDLASGKELRRLQGYPGVADVYNPVCQRVPFRSYDGFHLLDMTSGREVL